VILREIDFLLKICWSIPCLHPSWKVHTWIYFKNRPWLLLAQVSHIITLYEFHKMILKGGHRCNMWCYSTLISEASQNLVAN